MKPIVLSVDEAMLQRRSVRGFLPEEVPQAALAGIFEIAQRAPSNCNVQPWIEVAPLVCTPNSVR